MFFVRYVGLVLVRRILIFFLFVGFLFEFYYFIDGLIKKFKGFVFVIFMFFEYVVRVYVEVDG